MCVCTGAYLPKACVDHVTMQHFVIGLEGPGWLCKLPDLLMVRPWPWNPEVPSAGVWGG